MALDEAVQIVLVLGILQKNFERRASMKVNIV